MNNTTFLLMACSLVYFCIACDQPVTGVPELSPSQRNPDSLQTELQHPKVGTGQDPSDALAIFEKRILPIFNSPKPSSCTECHLAGMELKKYLTTDQLQTFASLKQQGLIDVNQPERSKILELIQREPKNSTPIRREIRQQELTAFEAWIKAAVNDPELLNATSKVKMAVGPELPLEVIRHAREDRILGSFVKNIWSELNRCAACHSPQRNQKQVKKYGTRVSWIAPQNPQQTLDYLIKESLIDADFPEESLLLTKPSLRVNHQGGLKISVGDRTYRQFQTFINDYSAIKQEKYDSANQLPVQSSELSHASELWLKITNIPEQFGKNLMRVDVYRVEGEEISTSTWASGDRLIASDKALWQQHLTVISPRDSKRAKEFSTRPQLPPGKYPLKIYVDQTGKLKEETNTDLGAEDLVAQTEIHTTWQPGYGRMTVVRFPSSHDKNGVD